MNMLIGFLVALVVVAGGAYWLGDQYGASTAMMHEDMMASSSEDGMMEGTSTGHMMASSSDDMMATSSEDHMMPEGTTTN